MIESIDIPKHLPIHVHLFIANFLNSPRIMVHFFILECNFNM